MATSLDCILIVDDDEYNNYLSERLIQKLCVCQEVKVVKNGLEALDFVKHRAHVGEPFPKLILLDLNMPLMDGFEFLEAYQSLSFDGRDNIQIVILTTSSYKKDMERANRYKIQGIVNKPLTREKLLDVIGTNGWHAQERQEGFF